MQKGMGDGVQAVAAAFVLAWPTIIIIIIIAQRRRSGGTPLPLPPGPRGWPVVGNLPQLGEKLHEDLFRLATKYGPLMSLQMGRKRAVVVSSPEMAKEFLRTNDALFSSRTITEAARVMTYDATSLVFSPYGERWRLLRKILTTEVLGSRSLQALEPLRRNQMDSMLTSIYDHSHPGLEPRGVGIADAAFAMSANVVSNVVSGRDMFEHGSAESRALRRDVWEMLQAVGAPNLSDLFPLLRPFDVQGRRRRVSNLYRRLDRYFDDLILDRTRNGAPPAARKDMLQVLVDYRFSHADIKGMLSDMFVAGTDTTSSTVEWGMTEILGKPEVASRIRAEMEEVVGLAQKVQESHICKLRYLEAAVKEVLRLHPGVPLLIPRRADEACDVAGFRVPEGAILFVNVWGMGRDPRVWGPDALEFLPDRFLRSRIDVKGHHFQLLPFGTGRRSCAGMPLGYRMVQFSLASLLHSFDWAAPPQNLLDLSERAGITLQKANPLVAIPTPRLPRNLYRVGIHRRRMRRE